MPILHRSGPAYETKVVVLVHCVLTEVFKLINERDILHTVSLHGLDLDRVNNILTCFQIIHTISYRTIFATFE